MPLFAFPREDFLAKRYELNVGGRHGRRTLFQAAGVHRQRRFIQREQMADRSQGRGEEIEQRGLSSQLARHRDRYRARQFQTHLRHVACRWRGRQVSRRKRNHAWLKPIGSDHATTNSLALRRMGHPLFQRLNDEMRRQGSVNPRELDSVRVVEGRRDGCRVGRRLVPFAINRDEAGAWG